MSGYTQIPNWLFDDIMPNCTPNEWRVVCVIARQTFGWSKECDKISLSLFTKLSGIGSRPTIVNAIESAIENGFIIRTKAGNSFQYSINNGLVSKPVQKLNRFRNQTKNGLETKPKTVQKLNTQKKKEKRNIYEHPDPEPIAEITTTLASICKTSLIMNEDDYNKAAYELFGRDATPDQIKGFSIWWNQNGRYEGAPALKSVLNNWVNYANGVTFEKHVTESDPAWNEIKECIKKNQPPSNGKLLQAVKAVGWPKLKTMNTYNETQLRQEFNKVYYE